MEEVCVLTCLILVNVAKTITTPNANVSAVKTNRGARLRWQNNPTISQADVP
jgi:hypothetical protein